MTDVLGHGPVAYYEQPLLITSIRPQSARSLPTTLQEQQFSESFELCIDAVSTATMDSLRSSYPTLAVTRSESDSTSPLQHIVAKLQLRREMQQHLREKPLHEHMRMHRRHKHAWKEKKTVELQKPVWQNGITTNEFAGGTKQAEYVVFPKTNGLRRGFWKSMSSPTPGEQNLKTQQKKQSAMYKRRYDPDKMNMSHVMKKLQLKSSHSAGEERKKPEAEGKDVARRSAPTTVGNL
ncbi:uncharacterized protein [Ptychodera flava]|uniref:uncharacterized protein n=1 Tax=Ptychodera flava TaxID=63121 RepID=UPI00396A0AA9